LKKWQKKERKRFEEERSGGVVEEKSGRELEVGWAVRRKEVCRMVRNRITWKRSRKA
jgi:hypothetical protein